MTDEETEPLELDPEVSLRIDLAADDWVRRVTRKRGSTPPPVLYHYTTLAGIHGILTSGQFWATEARFVADPTEGRQAVQFLESMATTMKSKDMDDLFYKMVLPATRWQTGLMKVFTPKTRTFIASFTDQESSLDQWRVYADDGTGVRLKIDPIRFSKIAGRRGRFIKVTYGSNEPRELVWHLCDRLRHLDKDLVDEGHSVESFNDHMGAAVVDALLRVGPFFKNDAYAAEREWRWAILGRNRKIRTKCTLTGGKLVSRALIPFWTKDARRDCSLLEVQAGPGDREAGWRTVAAISDMLNEVGCPRPRGADCWLNVCGIPYRARRHV